jgi:hypothetical protein
LYEEVDGAIFAVETKGAIVDRYSFVAEVTKSITSMIAAFAWPAGVVVLALLFRKKLAELLPLLVVKHKDLHVSFGALVSRAEEESRKLPPTPEVPGIAPDVDENARQWELARTAPRVAIIEARRNVDDAVDEFAEALSLPRQDMPHSQFIKELKQRQFIDEGTVKLLNEVRQIGNAAIHSIDEPTADEAVRYQALANRLVRQFNIAAGALNMPPPGPIPQGLP